MYRRIQSVFGDLGRDELKLPISAFEGDIIFSEAAVRHTKGSNSRPDVGMATVAYAGRNQNDIEVIIFKRNMMVYKRGFRPERVE